ncbi:competence/damage-inducible protein A [Enterococcus faecium]|uniref:competence/damage-inducible protein A n=1 Tax=Enterococcus faecium TaxID=1352 RepID=UPI000F4DB8A6|nr:competence/damage-inducible protein A [Enterococcus faecium]ROX56726.1 competence/damage-inducible protein A [Enterococcus faecium]ROY09464.1 competence/damage-inducible protein A [Enterococcus faecium]ROZ19352.1 competence/damage-inducible protein A [Enterococcus faecium]RXW52782.1 competence/damage-inducible protein A [Enterococcus faecium]
MKAEIIAVGTELLLGQVVNTNATFLSEQLADLGIEVYYQTVVGDNQQRLEELIALAETRSELILLCGGLGPTEDDLTKEATAAHLGKSLIQNTEGYKKLLVYFETTHRKMTKNNLQQSQIIEGGIPLPNRTGLALGTFYQTDTHAYILLPGPPNELKPMFVKQVRPLLEERFPSEEKLISKVLRFYGIGESRLVTELKDLIETQINPTIAPYAKPNEVTLRLTVKTNDVQAGNQALLALEEKIQKRVGEYFYGYGDDNSLAKVVVELLKENKQTVTAAESLTAGAFQAALGDIAGVSEVFPGGFVTYSLQTKAGFLEIDPELLAEYGTVSKECVEQMAIQAREIARTDYSVAFTGVAGPDTLEGQSAGTVWIAISSKDGVVSEKYHFARDRAAIRYNAVMQGFDLLRKQLLRK